MPDTLGLRGPVAQNLETAGFWVRSESDSECLASCIGENQPALGFTVTEGSRFVTPHKRGNARWEPQELVKRRAEAGLKLCQPCGIRLGNEVRSNLVARATNVVELVPAMPDINDSKDERQRDQKTNDLYSIHRFSLIRPKM